ncbi:MAG: hypothetical protein GY938_30610 [Ketobacter sp.]|nr:hypothetical protein [Ketobacter sp.]
MEDFIKAMRLFQKYMEKDDRTPFHCEHDVLGVCCVKPDDVSAEDKATLDDLGFFVSNEWGDPVFFSFRFGSC